MIPAHVVVGSSTKSAAWTNRPYLTSHHARTVQAFGIGDPNFPAIWIAHIERPLLADCERNH